MKRGIVTLPTELESINDNQGIATGRSLKIEDLNFFSLYWDEIVIPVLSRFSLGVQSESDFVDSGILKRPSIPYQGQTLSGGDIVDIYSKSQTHFLDEMRRFEPDSDWRLSLIGSTFHLAERSAEVKKSIRLEITNALPVPDNTVNIADILEFKERRRPELEAFNSYFDELYLEVVNSGDLDLSKKIALKKINKALQDLDHVFTHKWRSPIRYDASAMLEGKIADVIAGVGTIESLWASTHGDIPSTITGAAIALGAKSFGNIKLGLQSMRNKPEDTMAYLFNAHKEGIIKR